MANILLIFIEWVLVAVVIKIFNRIILFNSFNEKMPDQENLGDAGKQNSELIQIITSKFNEPKGIIYTKTQISYYFDLLELF